MLLFHSLIVKMYQNRDHIAINYSTHSTVVELFCFGLQSMCVPSHARTEPTTRYKRYLRSDRRHLHFVDFALCRWAPSSRVVTLLQLESRDAEVYIIVMCKMWDERSSSCGMWVIHYSAQYLTARRIDLSPQSNSQLTVSAEKQTNFQGTIGLHGATWFFIVKCTCNFFCRFVQTQMKPVYYMLVKCLDTVLCS